jgi:hypothetical protein
MLAQNYEFVNRDYALKDSQSYAQFCEIIIRIIIDMLKGNL